MSTPTNPRREHPSTYFVQDRSNEEELTRVMKQGQMLTSGMGGALPEQSNAATLRRVLDVSCGAGDWLIEVAKTYPMIPHLVGVDVSGRMVEYARALAEDQGLSNRMEFYTMDALRMLEFPAHSFDLVNLRCGWSYLRTWDWQKLLNEFQRICQPGGVIRVTEGNIVQSNSPALTRLGELFLQALYQAGHFFNPNHRGVIDELAHLLRKSGIVNMRTHEYALKFYAGTPEGENLAEDMQRAYRTFVPFLRKWIRVPDDYERVYQQSLIEMHQPDFVATWTLLTAWGNTEEDQ
ncbi:MAG TPA: class I SAM-dependent methyltransferase [Ktedonobacteraceae bacterium]|nr:class I SAM-dependent methyltransferase [Ktedonobacteraceae bacterium]